MLNTVKSQVEEMFKTLNQIIEQMHTGKLNLNEVASFIKAINNAVGEESNECKNAGEKLIFAIKQYGEEKGSAEIRDAYNEYESLFNDIPTQFKVVFLPYYESAWDSMESIWKVFKADPMFVTQVTLLSYAHDIKDGTSKNIFKDYLKDKQIAHVPYDKYDIKKDQPDIVFIAQPYDNIYDLQYVSSNIKKHTKLLVYVPYKNYVSGNFLDKPGHNAADLIITDGSAFMDKFKEYSKNGSKMVALGSPKMDYLYRHKKNNDYDKHPDWEGRIDGKTTFMLNTHHSTLLNTDKSSWLKFILDYIENDKSLALIWRPHPLTFSVWWDSYTENIRTLLTGLRKGLISNIILDETDNAMSAMMYSDGVISDRSSLVMSAAYLDKPVLLTSDNAIDAFYCYSDENDIVNFINTVKSGGDCKSDLRKAFVNDHMVNLDGACGDEILKYIKETYL